MQTHNLKIDAHPFSDLLSGAKTGEVRNDDRGFEVGDNVHLTCIDGRTMDRTISHIQRGYGLPDGICVLSYTRPDAPIDGLETVGYTTSQGENYASGCYLVNGVKLHPMEPLCLKSQAEAIIAAKDREIAELIAANIAIGRRQEELVTQLAAERKNTAEAIREGLKAVGELKADNVALTALVKELQEALRPFAEYGEDYFDKDNNGKPLPDEQGVGWIYMSFGQFRQARAALEGQP